MIVAVMKLPGGIKEYHMSFIYKAELAVPMLKKIYT